MFVPNKFFLTQASHQFGEGIRIQIDSGRDFPLWWIFCQRRKQDNQQSEQRIVTSPGMKPVACWWKAISVLKLPRIRIKARLELTLFLYKPHS